ncbi:hypothetical protein SSX86_023354 [Deinandra increscens subsp. villosa]|uniref:Pentatricopeptide repeat-containing protein n=1 Tax=Deinandra increscens subsp. villosa TaxID=3103831 RepID=A0AAP0GS20_9ASTR
MRRSLVKIYLHLPNQLSSSITSSISTIPNPNLPKFSRQTSIHTLFKQPISTFSTDNLEGLIDPHFISPENSSDPQIDSAKSANLEEEFAVLQGSLSAEKKIESCKCSDAYIISDAIRDNKGDFGDETYKFLSKFREKLSSSLVVDVLKLLPNAEIGIKFFIWAGRQIGYSHTLAVYDTLLDIMGCNNDKIPDYFLKEIKDDDNEVLGKLLNVLIRKYCRNGSWNIALEELVRLKDFGCKASRVTYNALIQVFLEADKLESADLVYQEMGDVGYEMDAHTFGSFAYSLCKIGKWREAVDMVKRGKLVADTVLYTRMIGGLCEGLFFEEAMEFLNRMRCDSCCPNVITYQTLLCGCLNKGKLGRCKRILSMMIAEGCYPSPKVYNSLVHAYCKSGDFAYAYKLVKETGKYGVRPGHVIYNIFIGGICGQNEMPSLDSLSLAEMAYGQMMEGGFVLNKVNVTNYAQCLCVAGKFERAYNVIQEMMKNGFVPDNTGLVPQARIWFDEMVANGCAPNVVTYTALIHSYLKANKIANANELFEMMLSCGCSPNVVTLTALVDGHCKVGQSEKALQIYTRMKGKEVPDIDMYFKGKESNTWEPNVVTYGALVDGLCKAHEVDQAVKLLDVMSEEGCEPNNIVYDALIDGLLKDGKLDEAEGVYTRMCKNGYNPNLFTYGAMIDKMFKDNRLDLASRVLSNMLQASCPPNVVIYTEMVDGLCKVGKTDEAYRLMEMMETKGCKPNVVTYTAMINGFGKAGKVEKSLEIFKQMGTKSCAPNYVTYKVLIHHCCASGLLDEAHGLLEEMKMTYWPKQTVSYRKVIEGFNRDFLLNIGLLDDISEYDLVPVIPVYRLLFDSYRKAGKLEVALELLKEISSLSSSIDKDLYFSMIGSLLVSHRVEKAFELYADMISKGGVHEFSVLANLVKENSSDPQIESAKSANLEEEFAVLQGSLSAGKKIESCKCSDAYIISNAIRDNKGDFGDETYKFLSKFREKLSSSLVVDVLKLLPNAEIGIKFFIWAGRQIGYSHTLAVYDTLLDIMKCNNDKIPDYFLKEIKDDDNEVLGKLLNVLIRKYCRNGSWNIALEELVRLKDFGCKASRVTYNALIQVFLEADKLESADLVYQEMGDVGYEMDAHTFGSFAYSLCKIGKWREAVDMVKRGKLVADTVLYTRMIGGLCEGLFFEEAMEFLNRMRCDSCCPNVITYQTLLCGCLNKGKLGRCKRILSMMIAEGCYPSPKVYNSLVHAYCKSGDFAYAYKLVKETGKYGVRPGHVIYNIFIGGICGQNEMPSLDSLSLAEMAYGQMIEGGFVLNKVNVTNYAQCLCVAGKFEKAYNVIQEMMKNGFVPDNSTYNKLTRLLTPMSCFEMMLSCGCSPNVVTLTALIDGHCKIGQSEKALQIYTRMKGKEVPDIDMYFKGKESNTWEPNVVTYGALVDGLCKAHKVDQAVKLLDVMSEEGCEPNNIVYDALIDGLLKDGKLDEAEGVYTRMCKNGYNPNLFTYGAMIDKMFKDNRLDLASRVLSNMLQASCPPNVVIYTEMVDGLCKVGKTDEAYRLMEMMETKGCKPNVVTYTAMINGFGKAGKVEKSLEIFKQMGTKSCAPNYVTYKVLIHHCCASGLLDEAHGLLEEMKMTYWPKQTVSYRKVIEGFNRDFLLNIGLLDDISEYDLVPVIPVYRLLFDSYRKAGKLEVALELLKEISSLSSSINKDLYFSMIGSLLVSHRVEKAFELYADMISKGGVHEFSVLVNLVKGLVKVNRWEEAFQLSHSLCYMDIQWLSYNNTNEK